MGLETEIALGSLISMRHHAEVFTVQKVIDPEVFEFLKGMPSLKRECIAHSCIAIWTFSKDPLEVLV